MRRHGAWHLSDSVPARSLPSDPSSRLWLRRLVLGSTLSHSSGSAMPSDEQLTLGFPDEVRVQAHGSVTGDVTTTSEVTSVATTAKSNNSLPWPPVYPWRVVPLAALLELDDARQRDWRWWCGDVRDAWDRARWFGYHDSLSCVELLGGFLDGMSAEECATAVMRAWGVAGTAGG